MIRTYRDYVNDVGQDVAVQAGPNGPENVSYFLILKKLVCLGIKLNPI